jgi:succinate dehydrogenase/fumarate reductase flavoprotein subunit
VKPLAAGCDKIDEVASRLDDLKVTDRSLVWNTDLIEARPASRCDPRPRMPL